MFISTEQNGSYVIRENNIKNIVVYWVVCLLFPDKTKGTTRTSNTYALTMNEVGERVRRWRYAFYLFNIIFIRRNIFYLLDAPSWKNRR